MQNEYKSPIFIIGIGEYQKSPAQAEVYYARRPRGAEDENTLLFMKSTCTSREDFASSLGEFLAACDENLTSVSRGDETTIISPAAYDRFAYTLAEFDNNN